MLTQGSNVTVVTKNARGRSLVKLESAIALADTRPFYGSEASPSDARWRYSPSMFSG